MLVAAGFANVEIAQRMGVATCTVRKHLEHAYRKLGVTNRLAAAIALHGRCSRPRTLRELRSRLRRGRRPKDSREREWPRRGRPVPREGVHRRPPWGAMHLARRSCAAFSAAFLITALLARPPSHRAGPRSRPCSRPRPRLGHRGGGGPGAGAAELGADRLPHLYADAATPIPVGVPVLGFTSLAMHRAVENSLRQARASSERAAVVAAAYQVLQHYYPKFRGKLQADRAAGLDARRRDRPSGTASRSGSGPAVASSTTAATTATSTRPSTTARRPAPACGSRRRPRPTCSGPGSARSTRS